MIRLSPRSKPSWRQRLVGDLTGTVLEIGAGKGDNLPHFRQAKLVCAIEPDPGRAEAALKKAKQALVPSYVVVAPAERLPFSADSFDTVVSSLVFCSVNDQRQSLREIDRVLKTGGILTMVEHVRPKTPLFARLFTTLTPWWRQIAHNCHLDRPTLSVLKEMGWTFDVYERHAVFVKLRAWRAADTNAHDSQSVKTFV